MKLPEAIVIPPAKEDVVLLPLMLVVAVRPMNSVSKTEARVVEVREKVFKPVQILSAAKLIPLLVERQTPLIAKQPLDKSIPLAKVLVAAVPVKFK